jgi:hypothetical protein
MTTDDTCTSNFCNVAQIKQLQCNSEKTGVSSETKFYTKVGYTCTEIPNTDLDYKHNETVLENCAEGSDICFTFYNKKHGY